ncbi:hypothetical protein PMAYCL1PPCAC_28204, partial [Pristionchus mayeri]
YAPKDNYVDKNGHHLRTKMAVLHWNEMKKDEMDGKRTVVGTKPYYNHTLKKSVQRNVKSPARNVWRESVKQNAYEIRASLVATPYAVTQKERKENQKLRAQWNNNNTPTVPIPGDPNLDASADDEDDLPHGEEVLDAVLEETHRL